MSETQPDQKLILLDTNVWIDYFVPVKTGIRHRHETHLRNRPIGM